MSDWEVVIRPHLTPYFAYAAAAVIVAATIGMVATARQDKPRRAIAESPGDKKQKGEAIWPRPF